MLGVKSIDKMIDKTALASLNDTFWLKKDSVDLSWEDVNLYDEQNNFDMRLFKAALMGLTEEDYVSYFRDESFSHVVTPELTTGGSYAKAWYRDKEHGLCLLKRGTALSALCGICVQTTRLPGESRSERTALRCIISKAIRRI